MKTIIRTFDEITDGITAFLYGENKIANRSFKVFAFVSICLGLAACTGMISIALG